MTNFLTFLPEKLFTVGMWEIQCVPCVLNDNNYADRNATELDFFGSLQSISLELPPCTHGIGTSSLQIITLQ